MNVEEFNTCVDLYTDIVYRYIKRYLSDSEMAKDILQDSFEKMWIKHKKIDSNKSKSYLITTAYNTAINQILKNKKMEYIDNINHVSL
jgi:RNA polymerase sigma factor (sigma-70 family)